MSTAIVHKQLAFVRCRRYVGSDLLMLAISCTRGSMSTSSVFPISAPS